MQIRTYKQPMKPSPGLKLSIVDGARNFFIGALEPLTDTIAMLIAINYFKASTSQKTLLAVLLYSGLLMGIPATIFFFKLKSLSVKRILSLLYFTAGIFVLSNIAFKSSPMAYFVFLLTIVLLTYVLHGTYPIITPIYSLWDKRNRGRHFMVSMYCYIIGSALLSFLATRVFVLDLSSELHYTFIWIGVALLCGSAGAVSLMLPSVSLASDERISLKSMLDCLKNDKVFIYVLSAWFILGAGNLWLFPYRTNLLSEKQFGFSYSISTVLVILVLLPEITRMVFMPLFAFLFDRINFILLRMILNCLLVVYSILFFVGNTMWLKALGMIFFGLAKSGSSIAWRLWINKFVPKHKVGLYMSIHSGLTGIRMITFPFLGLYALEIIGPAVSGCISALLFIISIGMFIPLLKFGSSQFNE